MEIPEGASKDVMEITFTYEVNGEQKVYKMNELGNLPADAIFVSRDEKLIEKGFEPKINNFIIQSEEGDHAEEFLSIPKVILITCYDLSKSNEEGLKAVADFAQEASYNGYQVVGLTASSEEEISRVQTTFKTPFTFYFCDGVTIKTIVRSNPGVVVLDFGIIKDKKHWNDLSDIKL